MCRPARVCTVIMWKVMCNERVSEARQQSSGSEAFVVLRKVLKDFGSSELYPFRTKEL